tara:strand:+ start:956 stop:1375 length:420 start_codon:yes stop_codon:yes gene_type:complete
MKRIFFIAFILTGQLFAQIESGLYYSEDIYKSDVENNKRYNTIKMETSMYLDIDEIGIRMYLPNTVGLYHGWKDIGFFTDYYTYLLTNNTKICVGPEINGIYYFYETEYDHLEYKKLIEFRDVIRVSDLHRNGNYLMER